MRLLDLRLRLRNRLTGVVDLTTYVTVGFVEPNYVE